MKSYKRNAFLYSTIVALGGFIFGIDAAVMSGTVDFITKEFGLDSIQLGFAVSAPSLGVLIALPFAGYISNALGRKVALQIVASLYVVSAVTSALAPSYLTLVGARFLGGLAFSSISLASMYIGEIAPPKWRGKLVSMTQINIVVGLSGAYFINYLLLQWADSGSSWVTSLGIDRYTWRWMLGSEIIPAIIWFGLLMMIPKSPAWLAVKGRTEEAKNTLRKVLPEEEVISHMAVMEQSMKAGSNERTALTQLKDIFSKPMRLTIIIAFTIAIVQQSTGINAIIFYAPTVFAQLGIGANAAFMQAIWIGLTSIVFTVLSILLIDRLGRKPMIISGLIWIIVSLSMCSYGFYTARYTVTEEVLSELTKIKHVENLKSIVGVEYQSDTEFRMALQETIGEEETRNNWTSLLQESAKMNSMLILIGILSFIAAFHFSVGPIMWVLFSEIFPISNRAIAIPFFTIVTSLTNYLVQQFFPWQLENFGGSFVFLFYASTVIIGLLILSRYLVETKNLSIEEIQQKLQMKS